MIPVKQCTRFNLPRRGRLQKKKKEKKKCYIYNSQRATSEGAQRVAHGSAVANPKVYFSVINGQLINRAQCAMQMLQGSYSD